jgi:predicted RNA-binding protein YlqC (UPF0109 family)
MPSTNPKSQVRNSVLRPNPTSTTDRAEDEPLSTRELCEEIALKIGGKRDDIFVTETREGKNLKLIIHCHTDDIGQMVGKRASFLVLLNTLLTRCEWRDHLNVTVDVARPSFILSHEENHD